MTEMEGGDAPAQTCDATPATISLRGHRRRLIVAAATVLGLGIAGVIVGLRSAGHIAAQPGTAPAPGTDVASALVNIQGDVPGGTVKGTGMLLDSSGTVLTNNHVIANTTDLTAQIAGSGPIYTAVVLGLDPTHDVAVIRLDRASNLPTVPLDTSGRVSIGEQVTGIGNALGRNGYPVSAHGAVTSLDETIEVRDEGDPLTQTLDGMICFDAPIQPGDSGGPLLGSAGQVIGMDTAASARTTTTATGSWGCAIPITRAIGIARQILAGVISPYIESGHRGALDIEVSNRAGSTGVYVEAVTSGQAAARAGIAPGDVLTAVAGVPVTSQDDLATAMKGRRPGDAVIVSWRDGAGAPRQAAVTLSPGPPA